ncbi:MAG: hypothetical protein IK081_06455 [Lachnospiraceae bacterium]|nr:hypothetical protein [Lachnospiraceae bacterium]
MSWDTGDREQWEQDYYDSRCYPEEYDCIEEYRLEHENGFGSGYAGIGQIILWTILLYVGFHVLLVAALFPPLGVLLFLGLVKVKSWFD